MVLRQDSQASESDIEASDILFEESFAPAPTDSSDIPPEEIVPEPTASASPSPASPATPSPSSASSPSSSPSSSPVSSPSGSSNSSPVSSPGSVTSQTAQPTAGSGSGSTTRSSGAVRQSAGATVGPQSRVTTFTDSISGQRVTAIVPEESSNISPILIRGLPELRSLVADSGRANANVVLQSLEPYINDGTLSLEATARFVNAVLAVPAPPDCDSNPTIWCRVKLTVWALRFGSTLY